MPERILTPIDVEAFESCTTSLITRQWCATIRAAWTERDSARAEVERLNKALEFIEFASNDNETRLTEYIVKLERVVEAARECAATWTGEYVVIRRLRDALAALEVPA